MERHLKIEIVHPKGCPSARLRVIDQTHICNRFSKSEGGIGQEFAFGGIRLLSVGCPECDGADDGTLYLRGSIDSGNKNSIWVPSDKIDAILAAVDAYNEAGRAKGDDDGGCDLVTKIYTAG